MILYFSGRVLLYAKPKNSGILSAQRPEDLLKNTSIMLSFRYIKEVKSQDKKRFLRIFKSRKERNKNEN